MLNKSPAKHHAYAATHHIHLRDVLLMVKLVLIGVEGTISPNHKLSRRYPSREYKATRTVKLEQKGIGKFIRKIRSQQQPDAW